MKCLLAIGLVILAVQPTAARQVKPSFDCSKANSTAEKLICSDDTLARLDLELSEAYQAARRAGTVDARSQLAWIKLRDFNVGWAEAGEAGWRVGDDPFRANVLPHPRAGCTNDTSYCLTVLMQERINELRLLSSTVTPGGGNDPNNGPLGARPPKFFVSVERIDAGVCDAVRRSLNQPPDVSGFDVNEQSDYSPNADILLKTDLEVSWIRKEQSYSVIDYANADLANNGKPVVVYRWSFPQGRLSERDELGIADPVPAELYAEGTSADLIRNLAGDHGKNVIEINPQTAPEIWGRRTHTGNMFLLDVITLRGKAFILAADAGEAARTIERGRRHPVDVYVLQYHSKDDISLVCWFRGGGTKQ